jgi:glutathione-regulated potassium-efflux system ancillary protein KefG
MPKKILYLFAHPLLEKSRVNKVLMRNVRHFQNITFRDLYEEYPEFTIDIAREKELLLDHDIIAWHHPLYWYSCPPLLKQWIDVVLEAGWAYGPGGIALKGKSLIQIITAGGPLTAYKNDGYNRFTIREFLIPFEQTAVLCHLEYIPPFVIHGTHRLAGEDIHQNSKLFNRALELLSTDTFTPTDYKELSYFNEAIETDNKLN